MTDQKIDDMMATGTHRAWVGEGVPRGSVRPVQDRENSRAWLERGSSNSRHGAITRSLNSWSNYKSWTEKVRTSWTRDDEPNDKDDKSGK